VAVRTALAAFLLVFVTLLLMALMVFLVACAVALGLYVSGIGGFALGALGVIAVISFGTVAIVLWPEIWAERF